MSKNLIVSLGHNCYVSWTLRKIGLQGPSFPIDWVNSFSFAGVLDFFSDSSSDFVNGLEPCKKTGEEENDKILYSSKYHFRLPHEYDLDPNKSVASIKKMYQRRIERFFEKCKEAEKIIFVRNLYEKPYKTVQPENLEQIDSLSSKFCALIERQLGNKEFIVIFSSYTDRHFKFTNAKCLYLNQILPFENGFFDYDTTKVLGNDLFQLKANFFDKVLEKDFSSLTDETLKEIYLKCYTSKP